MAIKILPRTLVADDSDSMRQMLIMMLKKVGITDIAQAGDGDEAIAMIKAGGIGLVLLDFMMPKVNGFEVLKEIRSTARTASLPVVLITANADMETVKMLTSGEAKPDQIIVKPLSFQTFKARIDTIVAAL